MEKKTYELTVLLHPDLEVDLKKPLAKIEKIITDHDGTIIKQDNWGKRKLAYPITHLDHAVYIYYQVELPGSQAAKLQTVLNITDEVIRFLIVVKDVNTPEFSLAASKEE